MLIFVVLDAAHHHVVVTLQKAMIVVMTTIDVDRHHPEIDTATKTAMIADHVNILRHQGAVRHLLATATTIAMTDAIKFVRNRLEYVVIISYENPLYLSKTIA